MQFRSGQCAGEVVWRGKSTSGKLPAVVDEGSKGEEHLIASGDVPERSYETQIDEVALAEVSGRETRKSEGIRLQLFRHSQVFVKEELCASHQSLTHVSSPLKRSVLTVTFQARKCSTQFEGLIVFRNKARNATLYLTFNLEVKEDARQSEV